MQFNPSLRKYALFIVFPLFLYAACTPVADGDLTNVDDNGGYASDASRIEWVSNDVISIADEAGLLFNGAYLRTTKTTLGSCATVGTDTVTAGLHTLVIRFGKGGSGGVTSAEDDCECLDGRKRRGTIIVKYPGHFFDSGTIHTITFDNYFINDIQLSGSIRTTIGDTTVTGNWHYNVQTNDTLNMSLDPLKSEYVVWNGSFDRKWIAGQKTPSRADDAFQISGSGTLTRPSGHQFTFNISSPLQVVLGCDFLQSGIVTVSSTEGSRVLNYGNGTCDAAAQVSKGGTTVYNFTMVK